LSHKNINALQNLINANAQKGYRFIGGFYGAVSDNGIEYSAWIFITDPNSETAMHHVIPIHGNFLDQWFFTEASFLEIIELWVKEGWEILSVVYGTKKEEKVLSYYPIVKYLPFVVVRQLALPLTKSSPTIPEITEKPKKTPSKKISTKPMQTLASSPELGKDATKANMESNISLPKKIVHQVSITVQGGLCARYTDQEGVRAGVTDKVGVVI